MIDSYFEIGSSHIACQDYTLHGIVDDMQYGIISDGCSTAEHSEIGAQILCHVTRYYLALYYRAGLFKQCSIEVLASLLGNSILKRADDLRKLYPITPAALQATLLIVVAVEKEIFLFVWGDGVIIERYTENNHSTTLVTKIDYSANAPFYLVTDPINYENFLLKDKGIKEPQKTIENFMEINKTTPIKTINLSNFQVPYIIKFPENYISRFSSYQITICSDGILSYKDENNNPIDFLTIIPNFIEFKSKNGEFVKKRMIFFKRQRKEWSHFDDVATATIIL